MRGPHVAQAAWDSERAEAEKQRVELSGAFDAQGAELEALKARITELEDAGREAAAAASEERANVQRQMAELTAERQRHQVVRTRHDALVTETATVSARLEAQSGVQRDVADRLQRTEWELTESRAAAAAAREEAAQLRGQAGALQTQISDLLQALNLREDPRDTDRPKKP